MSDLINDLIVGMILVDHKVSIVPLKIVRDDIDLAPVVLGQGVCPFEKISQAMFSFETDGSRIVFDFGNNEIDHVLFLGLKMGWIVEPKPKRFPSDPTYAKNFARIPSQCP